MKPSIRILPGLIAAAFGLSVAVTSVDTAARGDDSSFGSLDSSQGSQDASKQCEDLLRRARAAMAENDLQAADRLILEAESLGVRYGPLHFGDTPKRARRDLERKLVAKAEPTRPGRLFSPWSRDTSSPSDPFADYNKEEPGGPTAGRNDPGVSPLPPVNQITPIVPPVSVGGSDFRFRAPTTVQPNSDRVKSDELLLESRRALALGDVRTATSKVQQAKQLNVRYGPLDDSPEKVEAIIASYDDLMDQKAERSNTEAFRRQFARVLMEQAQGLLRWREYDEAERLVRTAAKQGVSFGPFEAQPEKLLAQIAAERRQVSALPRGNSSLVTPATGPAEYDHRASRAVYDPANDPTRNMLAGSGRPDSPATAGQAAAFQQRPTPAGGGDRIGAGEPSVGMALFQQAEAALKRHDVDTALHYFRQAAAYSHQLDPITAQRLQDALQMLSAPGDQSGRGLPPSSMLDDAAARQQVLTRQVVADVAHQESEANNLRQSDPKAALALLQQARQKVEAAGLEPATCDVLLRRLDRSIADTRQFIEQNRSLIELDEDNQRVRQHVERERELELEIQKQLALMVEEFNQLVDEQRFAEAEVVAKRAVELDPENPLTRQIRIMANFLRRHHTNLALRDAQEQGFIDQLRSVDESAIPFDDMEPYRFVDVKDWAALTQRRSRWSGDAVPQRSERELEIEQKLRTPVMLQFENAPLSQVMDYLAKLAGVNLFLDPQGLAEEGVGSDDPVSINLPQEISLKSALNLILRSRHLGYVIKDEVLKITSEQLREGDIYPRTYNVADLVVPIPNFVPSPRMGLAGAYHDALGNVGFGASGPFGSSSGPLAVVASKGGANSSASINPAILAQMSSSAQSTATAPASMPVGFGPGGLGGGAMADFDSLIDLITTTVQPESWEDVGGPGTIAPFETNLSLVISQTQEVHEEIVDLLEQLRRMQDLQVTIEMRFITLNDNFFERIGIDFDFDIDDDIDRPFQVFGRQIDDGDPATGTEPTRNTLDVDHDRSVTVGLQAPGLFSADLDIPFVQDSFSLSAPQFGGFDPSAGAQMGFAILSEIEAFFFINAAQGDRRSNVLQAPKVTLFNGQMAFVSDTSQSPFVISVIPVVGDFAAAQQPVIVVLNEGTFMTVQAVVSPDRRFVRLTVVPFFSRIGEVDTFQFTGSETSIQNTSEEGIQDEPNDNTKRSDDRTVSRQGTTVQLPTFSFVTVTTTVSVPDGGTVLLGGIKRLSEGRNEFGVPILAKLPYVNRLFKNVGIGREAQSLMMMVTPRIIIQEEEEEKLGIVLP